MKILSFPRCCSSILGGFLLGKDAHVHAAGVSNQLLNRTSPQARKSRALAMSHEQLSDSAGSGKLQKNAGGIVTFKNLDVGARRTGNCESRVQSSLVDRGEVGLVHV